MKKMLATVLALRSILAFAGCGNVPIKLLNLPRRRNLW